MPPPIADADSVNHYSQDNLGAQTSQGDLVDDGFFAGGGFGKGDVDENVIANLQWGARGRSGRRDHAR